MEIFDLKTIQLFKIDTAEKFMKKCISTLEWNLKKVIIQNYTTLINIENNLTKNRAFNYMDKAFFSSSL